LLGATVTSFMYLLNIFLFNLTENFFKKTY